MSTNIILSGYLSGIITTTLGIIILIFNYIKPRETAAFFGLESEFPEADDNPYLFSRSLDVHQVILLFSLIFFFLFLNSFKLPLFIYFSNFFYTVDPPHSREFRAQEPCYIHRDAVHLISFANCLKLIFSTVGHIYHSKWKAIP